MASRIWAWVKMHHLAILLGLVALKQVVLVMVIPPWQVPDEPAHFQYVQTMVEQNVWPVFQNDNTVYSREVVDSYNRMLHNFHGSIPLYRNDVSYNTPADISTRWADRDRPVNRAALYGPTYYIAEAIPYVAFRNADIETRLQAMRLVSSLLLVVLVWVAYRIGRRVRDGTGFATTLAVLIGFHPMLSYVSAGVNNDALFNLLGAMAFGLLFVNHVKITSRSAAIFGLLAGLVLFTKQAGWIFIPAVVVYVAWQSRRQVQTWATAIKFSGVALLVSTVVGFSWSVLSYLDRGGNFISGEGMARLNDTLAPTWKNILAVDLFERLPITFHRFWGVYGWSGSVLTPEPMMFMIILTVCVLGIIGLIVSRWTQHQPERPALWRAIWLGAGLWFILDQFFRLIFWHRAATYADYSFPAQGRYYFVLIIPIMMIMLVGLDRIVPPRWRAGVWVLTAGWMIAFSCLSMMMISRWYTLAHPVT